MTRIMLMLAACLSVEPMLVTAETVNTAPCNEGFLCVTDIRELNVDGVLYDVVAVFGDVGTIPGADLFFGDDAGALEMADAIYAAIEYLPAGSGVLAAGDPSAWSMGIVATALVGTINVAGYGTGPDFAPALMSPSTSATNAFWVPTLIQGVPVSITIDIGHGGDHAQLNPRSRGLVWVAVLSEVDGAATFDPLQIDADTVGFGSGGASPDRYRIRDVNKDGLADLLLRFSIPASGILCGDEEVTLTGETFDSRRFSGTGAIETVGCGRSLR